MCVQIVISPCRERANKKKQANVHTHILHRYVQKLANKSHKILRNTAKSNEEDTQKYTYNHTSYTAVINLYKQTTEAHFCARHTHAVVRGHIRAYLSVYRFKNFNNVYCLIKQRRAKYNNNLKRTK